MRALRTLLTVSLTFASAAAGGTPETAAEWTALPGPGEEAGIGGTAAEAVRSGGLREGWPVYLGTPGAGFPYTPTLFDITGDGCDEIFLTGGETFGLDGDGNFLSGWPTAEMAYMGYGTNAQLPGPSCAYPGTGGGPVVMWSQRDWYAGSAYMWSFNGREADGTWMEGFPQEAPDQFSNALRSPFVLGDASGDGILEAWSAHTLGNTGDYYRISGFDIGGERLFTTDLDPEEQILNIYFGDLDGDGTEEFFAVATLDGAWRVHAFNSDGSHKTGYPIVLFQPSGGYAIFGPPVPADLDGDGDLELLMGYNSSSTSIIEARHHDGSPCEGFPVTLASGSQLFYIGLGDVTGDGAPELIAFENELSAGYRVWVLDIPSGEVMPGWPFHLTSWPKGFPTVVDVDGDGLQDICFVTDGGLLYAMAGDGTVLEGFPGTMSAASISGVAAGDIDGNGFYDLVAATWDGWVYAWSTEGPVSGDNSDWPMRGVDERNTGVFRGTGQTGMESGPGAPSGFRVAANPFRGSAEFRFPEVEAARMDIYDVTGRRVSGIDVSGLGSTVWHPGRSVPAGMYIARLSTPCGSFATLRVVLLR